MAESAEHALTLCKAYAVDVAFIDARMQPISGIRLIGMIHKKYPAVKIVGMTTFNEEATIAEFIKAGVVGFLAKGKLNKPALLNCVHAVLAGETFFSLEVKKIMADVGTKQLLANTHLSVREYEIAVSLSKGNSAKEIGDQLGISKNTVDDYKKTMLEKTGAKNSNELVSFLHRNGLISNSSGRHVRWIWHCQLAEYLMAFCTASLTINMSSVFSRVVNGKVFSA